MQIREIMTKDVQIASPDDSLHKAAQLMRDCDIGVLPVGENDRLVGMLTDRDITVRAVAANKTPDQCKVRDVMSTEVRYVFDDQTTEEVARDMGNLQIRRLPVANRDKRLVGIVSLGDLAVEIQNQDEAERALSEISKPAHHG
ncbi:MAG TPA: CBS domain-containing protein [Azospirillum sp.]|nr:CBS domain-containing protein [Azospirillum sp.]